MPSKVIQSDRRFWGQVTAGSARSRGLCDEEHFNEPTIAECTYVADIAGAGTAVIVALPGGVMRCRDNGAAVDNHGGINRGGLQSVTQVGHARLEARAAVATTIANTRVWAVIHNAGAFLAVGDWIGFTFSQPVHANWRCMSSVGAGAIHDQDSGVPVVLGTYYRLMVELIPGGGSVFYINGAIVATKLAANTPGALLEPRAYVDDNASADAANHDLNLDFMNLYMDEGY